MTATELLTLMAASGVQLKRLPGDRIEAVGEVTDKIKSGMAECYQELLAVVPEPAAFDFRKLRSETIDQANALVPPDAFPTAEDWQRMDDADSDFGAAAAAGDVPAAREAAAAYVRVAEQINLRETAFGMPDDQHVQFADIRPHRLDKPAPPAPPPPPICDRCGFDLSPTCRAGTCRDQPYADRQCSRCGSTVGIGPRGECPTCEDW
jgi:hypothetical protein